MVWLWQQGAIGTSTFPRGPVVKGNREENINHLKKLLTKQWPQGPARFLVEPEVKAKFWKKLRWEILMMMLISKIQWKVLRVRKERKSIRFRDVKNHIGMRIWHWEMTFRFSLELLNKDKAHNQKYNSK